MPSDTPFEMLPDKFNSFFVDKVSNIRNALDSVNAAQPVVIETFDGEPLRSFSTVTLDQVKCIIMKSKKSFCELDSLPGDIFIDCIDILLPYMTSIFNDSLNAGVFPLDFKDSIVTPLIKKQTLDCNVLKNYRPVSNLSFVSKILEKIIFKQIVNHLQDNCLIDRFQSAYKSGHSTETALLKVFNDIVCDIDKGNVSFLTMLDLSAAFDTIDHEILFNRLSSTFGIRDHALNLLKTYLLNRNQKVKINDHYSSELPNEFGVPQGSVLGPLLFAMYIYPINQVIDKDMFSYHQYADDTQLYTSCKPSSILNTVEQITSSTSDINDWMTSNKLKMNNDKTEIMACGTLVKLKQINIDSVTIGSECIALADEVKDLGVFIDSNMSFNQHVSFLRKSCHFQLRKISSIRPFISEQSAKQLAVSLILSKLDYCNCLFYEMSEDNFNKLQLLQNHAARVVMKAKKYSSASALLKELHWLPVRQRVLYKIALLVFKCLNVDNFPAYLKDLITLYKPSRNLRSSDKCLLAKPFKSLKFGHKSFHYSAPVVWNELPFEIRTCTNLYSFKKMLKTHYFRRAFSL